MSVAPLSDLQRNKGEVRWTENTEASTAAQGPRPISHGGKSASSHVNGVIRGPDPKVPLSSACHCQLGGGADISSSADTVSQSWAFLCKEAWQALTVPQPLTFLA